MRLTNYLREKLDSFFLLLWFTPLMKYLKDKLINFIILLWVVTGCLALLFGLLEPSVIWLGTGDFPERDLLWLKSSPNCEASIWSDIFSGESDLCRSSYIQFTDAVGLNKIIHWLFDQNLLLIWFTSYVLLLLAAKSR